MSFYCILDAIVTLAVGIIVAIVIGSIVACACVVGIIVAICVCLCKDDRVVQRTVVYPGQHYNPNEQKISYIQNPKF